MSKKLLAIVVCNLLPILSVVTVRADIRTPEKPLEIRAQEADKVFVGVLINRKELAGDWCHADIKVTQAIKGVKVGELIPVLWRPTIARYDAKEKQVGLALLKYEHEKRYWLRSDTYVDPKLAEQAIKALENEKKPK